MASKEQVQVIAGNLKQLSYFQLLAVRPDASLEDIRKAFQQFALQYHPDQFVSADEQTIALATLVYQRGVEAYTVLRDETTAAAYRKALQNGRKRLSPTQRIQATRERALQQIPQAERKPRSQPPLDRDAFWRKMKTDDGKQIARRVEKMLAARRYREAYLQLGLLETVEPNNQAVEKKANWLSRYMKKRGI